MRLVCDWQGLWLDSVLLWQHGGMVPAFSALGANADAG